MTDFEDDWALLRPKAPTEEPVQVNVRTRLGPLDPYALVALDDGGQPRDPFLLLLEDGEGALLGLNVSLRREGETLLGTLVAPRAVEVHTGVLLFGGREGIRVRFDEVKRLRAGDTLHIALRIAF